MSVGYQAIGWNRQKRIYDGVLVTFVFAYLALFLGAGAVLHPSATAETLLIRGFGTLALLLLHVILCIGPLCRLDRRFLPLLYNRRHMGVTLFLFGLAHGLFSLIQFHALGDLNPLVSLFVSGSFQVLGFYALLILFVMAATSHDFWLHNLSAPVWKRIHMLVYGAYALLIAHVSLGALQSETSPLFAALLGLGITVAATLHLAAALNERCLDRELTDAVADGFVEVREAQSIPQDRARSRHFPASAWPSSATAARSPQYRMFAVIRTVALGKAGSSTDASPAPGTAINTFRTPALHRLRLLRRRLLFKRRSLAPKSSCILARIRRARSWSPPSYDRRCGILCRVFAAGSPELGPIYSPHRRGTLRIRRGHPLEILAFPAGKGNAKWHRRSEKLFLGIDHTAIVITETEKSLAFYRDILGLQVVGESENYGPEQERLNNVFGARLRITALRAASGPGIEFLEYLAPGDGRPYPPDERSNDLLHWQTKFSGIGTVEAELDLRTFRSAFISTGVVELPDAKAKFRKSIIVRDPDGHAVQIVEE